MQADTIKTIGILGAGKVGTALARQAVKVGYAVRIATAKAPSEIALIAELMAPGAMAVSVETAIGESDVVVLSLPLSKYRTLDPSLLAGKVVIDVMNYWAPTDGTLVEFESDRSSSEIVQDYLPGARLVRTLNHIGYHELEEDDRPPDHAKRRALAIASDDDEALATVATLIDRFGYDPVNAGKLRASRKFTTGTAIFSRPHQRGEMEEQLAADSV